jgi:hypothetical protein
MYIPSPNQTFIIHMFIGVLPKQYSNELQLTDRALSARHLYDTHTVTRIRSLIDPYPSRGNSNKPLGIVLGLRP